MTRTGRRQRCVKSALLGDTPAGVGREPLAGGQVLVVPGLGADAEDYEAAGTVRRNRL